MTETSEKPYERRAADAVGLVLGRTLRRFDAEPDGDDSLDYIDERREVYEMKLVTPQEYEELRAARTRHYPSGQLKLHWSLLIRAPTLEDKFRPMPSFPNDDPATIETIEADGVFTVQRKAEREAEWQARYAGRPLEIARIGTREAELLVRHLSILERGGILVTRGANPRTADERTALAEVLRLTHGAIAIAHPAQPGAAGITVRVGWGYTRSGDPNVLAFRAQAWLDSRLGANLAHSLAQSRFERRHGVLTFDASEPEYWSAMEGGTAFVPTVDLVLPPEVDTLWCLVGRVLLRYDSHLRWRAFDAEPEVTPSKPLR